MIKLLTLALTITALTLGPTFAGCCDGDGVCKSKAKPTPTATPAKP